MLTVGTVFRGTRFPNMHRHKIRNFAVSAAAGIGLAAGHAATASAEIGIWAVPPQNNFQACFGGGSAEDIGVPLDVQINDRYGPYRADQVVMVSDMSGVPVVRLACSGPAVQIRLRPGSYRIVAFVGHAVRSPEMVINVPDTGASVVLTMSDVPDGSFDTANIG